MASLNFKALRKTDFMEVFLAVNCTDERFSTEWFLQLKIQRWVNLQFF